MNDDDCDQWHDLTRIDLWLMPQDNLHITALEMTHSKKAEEIQQLVDQMREKLPSITNYTFDHRARLVKPMIGFDASALALSFVPAAAESLTSGRTLADAKYTYHHLRRDLYTLCQETGVTVDSRYVVPSAHLTIGRFIESKDFVDEAGKFDPEKMEIFVKKIEEVNAWLQKEYWPEFNGGSIPDGGDWILGEEKGLDCRMGTVW
jgi:vesicle-fusing ATPase